MTIELTGKAGSYRPPAAAAGKWTPVAPMRKATVSSMHKLSGQLKDSHHGLGAHQHVTDAAHALDRGDHDAAIRHLNAGIANLTPQSLLRHGFTNDEDHIAAKASMDAVHRHLLLTKDIQEVAARNQALTANSVPATQEDEIPGKQPAASTGNLPPGAVPPPKPLAPPPPAPVSTTPGPTPAKPQPPQLPGKAAATAPVPPQQQQKPQKQTVTASNGDLTTAVELSAETARLAVSPAPRGKPGGPGLYGAKGNMHSPYMQQIVKALIEKRGMDPGHAYAIAWSQMRKWSATSKHPEVRAASASGLGLEKVAEARAHAHANGAGGIVDLVHVHFDPGQPRDHYGRWSKTGPADIPAADKAALASRAAATRSSVSKAASAAPGSPGHAKELRQLASEAQLHQGKNFTTLKGSAEGMASDAATRLGAGLNTDRIPESELARPLKRAAQMIEGGQPSLARLHSGTIRNAAAQSQLSDPLFAARLSAAADKLDLLPSSQGLAGLPPQGADETARTKAARQYAGLSNADWARIEREILLTGTAAGAAQDTHTVTGQFGPAGSKPDAHQQHVAHLAAQQKKGGLASQTASKSAQITGLKKQLSALQAQAKTLQGELASASGKTSSGQGGSTTSAGSSTTASSAPAASTSSSSSSSSSAPAASTPSSSSSSTPSATQVAAWKAQLSQVNQKIGQVTAQLAKLSGSS